MRVEPQASKRALRLSLTSGAAQIDLHSEAPPLARNCLRANKAGDPHMPLFALTAQIPHTLGLASLLQALPTAAVVAAEGQRLASTQARSL
eukprot:CAMPEP_0172825848 /NCGR_PEP_ID=MMETSP1075-20121228/18988_1 /TAXON_ID=2916 /ORGANISM="Ceratium fusus, Strain PA161109" /LENGTH=90 /DNA_ID=CAMNT_0013667367 /DNA_START=10 /DNA_END=281 /DNA_ORIENTATION=+